MSDITLLAGCHPDTMNSRELFLPFDKTVLSFLENVSDELMKNPLYRAYPNLVALGFWLRCSSLSNQKDSLASAPVGCGYFPAGLVFHLAPSNVDNLFIYSWIISLLCGNANIVRVSSKASIERDLLLSIIKSLFENGEYEAIALRNAFISYPHDDDITRRLFANIDRRVLWGSDETVSHIRSIKTPLNCQDVIFSDRKSAAVFSKKYVNSIETVSSLIEKFYRDAYGFEQMACSSPKFVIWIDDHEGDSARAKFWEAFAGYVAERHPELSTAAVMEKIVAMQSFALSGDVRSRSLPGNLLQVVQADAETLSDTFIHPGGGLFIEVQVKDLSTINWATLNYQTLVCEGVDRQVFADLAKMYARPVADRIVPVGQALNFEAVWDGVNLFERLSRVVAL